MRRHSWRLAAALFGFSIFFESYGWALAAEKPPLYQGKTLNIVINFAAGGPTDIESRIFAKHLSRHIPGQSDDYSADDGRRRRDHGGELYRRSG